MLLAVAIWIEMSLLVVACVYDGNIYMHDRDDKNLDFMKLTWINLYGQGVIHNSEYVA